jgi:hypothetical protein
MCLRNTVLFLPNRQGHRAVGCRGDPARSDAGWRLTEFVIDRILGRAHDRFADEAGLAPLPRAANVVYGPPTAREEE